MRLTQRFESIRPLEEMELALVRAALDRPALVDAHEEATLRTALSLARMYRVRHEARDVGVGAFLEPFRDEIVRRLGPALLASRIERTALLPHLRDLKERTLATREALVRRFENRLPEAAIDQELRHKALVMVLGGGGGTGYVYAGAMGLLDEYGLRPSLLVGTSIGAVLSLFRSRVPHFDLNEIMAIVRSLSWRRLFRIISTQNRYGLPAALRLFLRSGIGRWFGADHPEAGAVRLRELPIKTIVTVSGIRRGKLPHPVEFYERLVAAPRALLNPLGLARGLGAIVGALSEFFNRPDVLARIHLGADSDTAEFDAVDAAGFSSALPGVIHYDVLRDDARMHQLLGDLFQQRGVVRLVDGGLVDNLPARAAWRAVHKGALGTRNALILALNGFAMRVTTPLWLPLQRLAEVNVARNRPWAHLVHDFRKTLSPLELVPSVQTFAQAVTLGREQLAPSVPLLARLVAPLPRLRPASAL